MTFGARRLCGAWVSACSKGFSFDLFPEVCGKFWDSRAHRPFREKKPQVEALRNSNVLGMFDICRILPDLASMVGFLLPGSWQNNGQQRRLCLRTKTLAGAKLLLPALTCLLVTFTAREEARLVLLRLRRLRAQLVADEVERCGDGLVHVVVLVAAQASGEDHVALLRRQLLVLLVQDVGRLVDRRHAPSL